MSSLAVAVEVADRGVVDRLGDHPLGGGHVGVDAGAPGSRAPPCRPGGRRTGGRRGRARRSRRLAGPLRRATAGVARKPHLGCLSSFCCSDTRAVGARRDRAARASRRSGCRRLPGVDALAGGGDHLGPPVAVEVGDRRARAAARAAASSCAAAPATEVWPWPSTGLGLHRPAGQLGAVGLVGVHRAVLGRQRPAPARCRRRGRRSAAAPRRRCPCAWGSPAAASGRRAR